MKLLCGISISFEKHLLYYFSERFGIHWVNFTHPDRPRIPKNSAIELKKIFAENGFPGGASTVVVSFFTYIFTFVAVMYARLF